MTPIFVAFEGIDRCGKTEQANLLRLALVTEGCAASTYSTPDRRTVAGELAGRFLQRQVGLAGRRDESRGCLEVLRAQCRDEALALQCLLTCARYEVAAHVRQDLRLGRSVTCSRWWPSAVVYAEEDGLDPAAIRAHSSFLPEPDYYVLLDARPEDVAKRLDPRERYEASLETQGRLALAYRRLWAERAVVLPSKWLVVDASKSVLEVSETVWEKVVAPRDIS